MSAHRSAFVLPKSGRPLRGRRRRRAKGRLRPPSFSTAAIAAASPPLRAAPARYTSPARIPYVDQLLVRQSDRAVDVRVFAEGPQFFCERPAVDDDRQLTGRANGRDPLPEPPTRSATPPRSGGTPALAAPAAQPHVRREEDHRPERRPEIAVDTQRRLRELVQLRHRQRNQILPSARLLRSGGSRTDLAQDAARRAFDCAGAEQHAGCQIEPDGTFPSDPTSRRCDRRAPNAACSER